LNKGGAWELPIIVENRSSAVGRHTFISVEVLNPSDFEKISSERFDDASKLNPGKTMFHVDVSGVIHHKMNRMAGILVAKMKVAKRAKRKLKLRMSVFSDKMRTRHVDVVVHLAKKGAYVVSDKEEF